MLAETNQDTLKEETPPQTFKKRRTFLRWLLFMVMIVVGVGIGVMVYITNALQPLPEGPVRSIVIPQGVGSSQIADILESEGIIDDAFVFKLYLRYEQEGSAFQAGEYAMQPGMTHQEIIAMLNTGDVIQEPTDRVTIPEGYTIKQMAEKLPSDLDPAVFLELANQPSSFEFSFIDSIPEDQALTYALEGYLFPETYDFKIDSTEHDIMQRMLFEMENRLQELPEDWQQVMENKGLTFHHLLTIASLIEREVIVDHERPLVAGVIYNRLNIDMMLQIDATVQYVLDKQKERLLYADLEVDSPYNTYKITGLPPGPIASPSISSIKAALYPEASDYLFYVTKKDGTNEHLFATTYEEHLNNIEKSKQTAD